MLAQGDEHAGPGERRPQLAVGDLAEQDDPVGQTESGRGPANLVDVVAGCEVTDEHQTGIAVEIPCVESERGDQLVLALVADQPAHVEPVVGGVLGRPRGPVPRGELAEVHTHRQDLDPAESRREHLTAVEVRDRDAEQRAVREKLELLPTLADVTPDTLVLEVPLGRHVVVHDDHVVRKVDHVVERVVADRVMDQQQLGAQFGA